MDVETAALRSAGSTLTLLALGWLGAPATTTAIPAAPLAFGSDPAAAELGRAFRAFAERAQESVTGAALLLNAAGEALLGAGARFDAVEHELATAPR